jgi:hypothetical protein
MATRGVLPSRPCKAANVWRTIDTPEHDVGILFDWFEGNGAKLRVVVGA